MFWTGVFIDDSLKVLDIFGELLQQKYNLIFVYLPFLTGELLKVLNRFYKRKEMQKLAADQGLDGKNLGPMIIITWSYIINIGQP